MARLLPGLLLAASLPAQTVLEAPQWLPISPGDGPTEILTKASAVRPHPRQLSYHQEEFIGFIHFGINTFTGREWGSGKERAADFAPPHVDTDQWARVMKAAGMRKIILTVKHHDGFCLWQTRYNDKFSVKASPWRAGQGDVLRLLADSVRRHGLRLGVYISPADLYQIESEGGLYGNGSKPMPSVIPTDPRRLQSDPRAARASAAGLPRFEVIADDYNRYMMNQLYEVLTEYGPVHEVWFDGAHPKRKGGQTYIKPEWFKMIRRLQPQAVIFGGPDARWCGNERGATRASEWNVLGVASLALVGLDRPADRIGDDRSLTAGSYSVYGKKHPIRFLNYLVSEVDTSIRNGWFWRNDHEQKVRNADEIFDIYERAVGNGSVFLLNVPPDKQGRLSTRDVECLHEVGARRRSTYGQDLLAGASASQPNLLDHNIRTFWQTPNVQAAVEISLPQPRRINRFVVQEAIADRGQRIADHALDAWEGDRWVELCRATTVGHKRILRFASRSCQRLRLRILAARAPAGLADLAAYYYDQPPCAVSLEREASGLVRLRPALPDAELQIHYTLDGRLPTPASPVFDKALELPRGATVQARGFVGGRAGPLLMRELGLAPALVQATATSQQARHPAGHATDGKPGSFWQSRARGPHPPQLDLRLLQPERLRGFTYLPPQRGGKAMGMISAGRLEASLDGSTWTPAGKFEFGNLVNSPDRRFHLFSQPIRARHLRLIATKTSAADGRAAIAELELLALLD